MKVAIGQLVHETNTFSNVRTDQRLFEQWDWSTGDAIREKYTGVRDSLGGMIDGAARQGVQLVPTFSAYAYPSGLITEETYRAAEAEILNGIERAGQLDAICLALHGAAVTEKHEDLESRLLAAVRRVIGTETPLVATLDLHGNMTEEMVEHADVLLGVNYYPHIDFYERGVEAISTVRQIVEGEVEPLMRLMRLPLLLPMSTTNLPPAQDINRVCWEQEEDPHILDCTFFHGFPYADIKKAGASVVATADGRTEAAEEAIERVAQSIQRRRDEFYPDYPSPAEGLAQATAIDARPVIINETSDNPGLGCPGDGTRLLKAMLEAGTEEACFGYVFDPEVAEAAHKSGVGEYLDISLGGKTDALHGEPLECRAYVKTLTDGRFVHTTPMWQGKKVDLGRSARLQIDSIDVLVCSVKSQVLDEQVFALHGIEVGRYKIVALKSSQHFRAAFEHIAKEIITVDAPGLGTSDLSSFSFKNLRRPIYPFDVV
jgi:microcystin degradation protein MlrC